MEQVLIKIYMSHLGKVKKTWFQIGLFTLAFELVSSTFLIRTVHLRILDFKCSIKYTAQSNEPPMFNFNFGSNPNFGPNSNIDLNSNFDGNLNSDSNKKPK